MARKVNEGGVSSLQKRFDAKYVPEPNTGCWLWTASCLPSGYGEIKIDGKVMRAHRASYELHHGPIPVGLCVLHKCDTPPCVNPAHLFLGTHHDMRDMPSKGRRLAARGDSHWTRAKPEIMATGDSHWTRAKPGMVRRGEKHARARLTEANISYIRDMRGIKTVKDLATELGVSKSTISHAQLGRTWNKGDGK
jgi:hypothetical protein